MTCQYLFYVLFFVHALLESLPISSSGHMRLISYYYRVSLSESVTYLLHIPTALVVTVFLWHQYGPLVMQLPDTLPVLRELVMCIAVADSITVAGWIFFKKVYVPRFSLSSGFLVTLLLLLSLFIALPGTAQRVSLGHAVFIGCAQTLALLPGISRLATTYTVGYWLGLAPISAVTFSLAIELPLIVAALTQAFYDSVKGKLIIKVSWLSLFVTSIVSALCAYKVLEWVVFLAITNTMGFIGIYMIIPLLLSYWVMGKEKE